MLSFNFRRRIHDSEVLINAQSRSREPELLRQDAIWWFDVTCPYDLLQKFFQSCHRTSCSIDRLDLRQVVAAERLQRLAHLHTVRRHQTVSGNAEHVDEERGGDVGSRLVVHDARQPLPSVLHAVWVRVVLALRRRGDDERAVESHQAGHATQKLGLVLDVASDVLVAKRPGI